MHVKNVFNATKLTVLCFVFYERLSAQPPPPAADRQKTVFPPPKQQVLIAHRASGNLYLASCYDYASYFHLARLVHHVCISRPGVHLVFYTDALH